MKSRRCSLDSSAREGKSVRNLEGICYLYLHLVLKLNLMEILHELNGEKTCAKKMADEGFCYEMRNQRASFVGWKSYTPQRSDS